MERRCVRGSWHGGFYDLNEFFTTDKTNSEFRICAALSTQGSILRWDNLVCRPLHGYFISNFFYHSVFFLQNASHRLICQLHLRFNLGLIRLIELIIFTGFESLENYLLTYSLEEFMHTSYLGPIKDKHEDAACPKVWRVKRKVKNYILLRWDVRLPWELMLGKLGNCDPPTRNFIGTNLFWSMWDIMNHL